MLANAEGRKLRRDIEATFGQADPDKAKAEALPTLLASPDRFTRNAARIWLEFQGKDAVAALKADGFKTQATLEYLLALAHVSAADPAHRPADAPKPDPAVAARIYDALDKLDWAQLDLQQRLDVVRLTEIVLNRWGKPAADRVAKLTARFDAATPANARELNVELANVLVYLEAPSAAGKVVALLESAPTQEEQMEYGRALRVLKTGWSPDLRLKFFSWLGRTGDFKGGPSLGGFLKMIRTDAEANLSPADRAALGPVLDDAPKPNATPAATTAASIPPRAFVKAWTLDEVVPVVDERLHSRRDFDKGRALFGAASCSACHRYNDVGGAVGPDLSAVAGRFSARDLLESIVLPSKVISDQYGAVVIETSDGKVVTGRIMNLHGDNLTINTNMLDPSAQVNVDVRKIEENRPSTVSMMPEGLLSTLNEDEVADLVAFLLSRGDRTAKMFR